MELSLILLFLLITLLNYSSVSTITITMMIIIPHAPGYPGMLVACDSNKMCMFTAWRALKCVQIRPPNQMIQFKTPYSVVSARIPRCSACRRGTTTASRPGFSKRGFGMYGVLYFYGCVYLQPVLVVGTQIV